MPEERTYNINLKCIFCRAKTFQLPYEGYKPVSGDMIRCANCSHSNDYTFIRRIAINKIVAKIEKDFTNEIKSMFKKAGFKVK